MKKFAFGANWKQYVGKALTSERVLEARQSLLAYLPEEDYKGFFIDIGCGSGIFSLAALAMGCARCVSIDVDRESLEAARIVKDRFSRLVPSAASWDIVCGDILNLADTVALTGRGDIVYSWGVLHHTGDMYRAIANAARLVKPGGYFIIALYNHAPSSDLWLVVKRAYVHAPAFIQMLMVWFFYGYAMVLFGMSFLIHLIFQRRVRLPKQRRGMSHFYNMVDWVGGYPYEYASHEEVAAFVENIGFALIKTPSVLSSRASHWWDRCTFKNTGNNEFVFKKNI